MQKAISGLTGAGALLLALTQFLPLYHTHVATTRAPIGSATVGADHAYGVLVLAVAALVLAAALAAGAAGGAVAGAGRFALALIGLLGLAALAVGLGHDLSDAHAHGLARINGHYTMAHNVIAAGFYLEIAGALVLLAAAVLGFLLGGVSLPRSRRATRAGAGARRHRPAEDRSSRV